MHSSPRIASATSTPHTGRTGRAFVAPVSRPISVWPVCLLCLCASLVGCFAQIDEARDRARPTSDAGNGLDIEVIGPSLDSGDRPDSAAQPDATITDADASDAVADGSGDTGDAIGFDVPVRPVAFDDVAAMFQRECTPCHIDRVSGGLSLLEGEALYDRLLAPSVQLPSMARVNPGEPATSYLWLKLEGTHTDAGGLGEPMPLGGAFSSANATLLRRWIEQGAGPE
jgi:hypothetical protein